MFVCLFVLRAFVCFVCDIFCDVVWCVYCVLSCVCVLLYVCCVFVCALLCDVFGLLLCLFGVCVLVCGFLFRNVFVSLCVNYCAMLYDMLSFVCFVCGLVWGVVCIAFVCECLCLCICFFP